MGRLMWPAGLRAWLASKEDASGESAAWACGLRLDPNALVHNAGTAVVPPLGGGLLAARQRGTTGAPARECHADVGDGLVTVVSVDRVRECECECECEYECECWYERVCECERGE